jgi:hypothetical protein
MSEWRENFFPKLSVKKTDLRWNEEASTLLHRKNPKCIFVPLYRYSLRPLYTPQQFFHLALSSISCHPWLMLVRQPALHTCLAHCIDPTAKGV